MGPVVAPLLGGFIIQFASWHAIFWVPVALGPVLHLRFGKNLSPYAFTYVLVVAGIACGIAMFVAGDRSVWLFATLMVVFATLEATMRPYATNLLLGFARKDTGSASTMINFLNTAAGVAGMALIMLPFPDCVVGIGVILIACMVVALPLWALACRSE